jgi:hypothetical protein
MSLAFSSLRCFSKPVVALSLSWTLALVSGCGSVSVETDSTTGGDTDTEEPGIECEAPLADCNGIPQDGCEADTQHDGDHCGACDADCHGGACIDGKCTAAPENVTTDQQGPCEMESDATGVFWANCNGGKIRGLLGPDEVTKTLAPSSGWIGGIALDTDAVLWTVLGEGVKRVPKNGGMVEDVATDQDAWSVAVDEERIYWSSYTLMQDETATGALRAVSKAGGDPVELAAGPAKDIALDSENIYWVTEVIAGESGQIWRMPKAGGTPIMTGVTQGLIYSFFVKGVSLYVVDDRGLVRMPVTGGPVEEIDSASGPASAVGEELWYQRGQELVRRPIEGGPATSVAWISEGYISGIAGAWDQVYWGNFNVGTIDTLPQ